jgi:peptidoglycan/xylan/chitin deacetylase (PgdA/CDA1 family)
MLSRLIKLSISLAFYSGRLLALNFCRLFRIPFPGPFVVLFYHSVKDSQRSAFSKHLGFMTRSGRPVPADFEGPIEDYQRYISLTFDDGYQSFLKNVLPEVRKYRIPTALFVPTGNLGKKPAWVTDSDCAYVNETIMTEDQLRLLPLDLVTVGSHSVSHPHLTQVSQDTATRELLESKNTLEEMLRRDITVFSLPYGSFNLDILRLAKKTGYKRVFLHSPTFPCSARNDHLIGRIEMTPADWPVEYHLKILGAYQWLPFAIVIKRRLLGLIKPEKAKCKGQS